jgi:hypothetical protein
MTSLHHENDRTEIPVIKPMRQQKDVDLAVNEKGEVFVFYDGYVGEDIEYAVYSIDDSCLYFVTYVGRTQDIGMTIHEPMRRLMEESQIIYIVEMPNKIVGNSVRLPLIVQNIGF